MVRVDGFDHIVLTVRDIRATCDFYSTVLGMRPVLFDVDHWALEFRQQKIMGVTADRLRGSADDY